MSQKSSLLIDILNVEAELMTLRQNKSYRKMKQVIQKFSQLRGGFITIPSPENFDKQITLRKNTDEFNDAFEQYEDKINVYNEKLKELVEKRRYLEKKLFG
jgi:hypothetical protein